jgi:hypothetical protein
LVSSLCARSVASLLVVLTSLGCASTIQHKDAKPQSSAVPTATPPQLDLTAPPPPMTTTGNGWDAKNIYIGLITENDAERVAKGLGLSNLDPGDQDADARAEIAAINRAGGVFGRKLALKPYNTNTFALLASPDTQAAGACTHFTQDSRVAAVVNDVTIIDTPAFKACFARNHLPLFEGSQQPTDTKALLGFGGYIISVLSPSYTAMAPTLVRRLDAESYFTPWNPETGSPGSAPVKVGILTPHDATGAEAARLLSAALTTIGHPPAEVYSYSASGAGSGTQSSAAYRFHAQGVTHVIGTGLNTYLFMQPAEAQGYRPRYGVSTFNGPGVLLEHNVPRTQLGGSLGIGTDPTGDVGLSEDPGNVSTAERDCLETMHAAGQDFGARRLAEAVALFDCDAFRLVRDAMKAGGGITAEAIVRGVQIAGPTFVPAETFSSGLGPGAFALAGSARDLGYDEQCSCYRYLSTVNHRIH